MIEKDELGLVFVPRFVRQVSDLEYGSVMSHENLNEKLNLNSTQGDYNSEVLRILFTERDATKTYRIPYLDNKIDTEVGDIKSTLGSYQDSIDTINNTLITHADGIANLDTAITNIINGQTVVTTATVADAIAGVHEAGVRKYYGTDFEGAVGYHDIPAAIFTGDLVGELDLLETYYVPNANSVEESMLTSAVRAKLNKQAVADYPSLSDKPKINNVEINGNMTLAELGIQPAGNYLTSIPDEYVTSSELTSSLTPYAKSTDVAGTYATKTEVTNLSNTVSSNASTAASTYTVCYIGTAPANAKKGDLLVVI